MSAARLLFPQMVSTFLQVHGKRELDRLSFTICSKCCILFYNCQIMYILYRKERILMRSLYILLTRSQTIASRIIYVFTRARFTHSSLSFGEELHQLYSFGRTYAHLPLPAGYRVESLRKGFYKNNSHIPCALYAFHVSDESYEAARSYIADMEASGVDYRYNIIGLLLCSLGITHKRRNKYFCSEFIAEVLQKSDAIEMPDPPSLTHPIDYASMPGGVCLYEGTVGELVEIIDSHLRTHSGPIFTSVSSN